MHYLTTEYDRLNELDVALAPVDDLMDLANPDVSTLRLIFRRRACREWMYTTHIAGRGLRRHLAWVSWLVQCFCLLEVLYTWENLQRGVYV
jgi:hypothetical protein